MDPAQTPTTSSLEKADSEDVTFSIPDLQSLLPKDRVSRLEYRRRKKSAQRKVNRQLEAKIKIDRETELLKSKGIFANSFIQVRLSLTGLNNKGLSFHGFPFIEEYFQFWGNSNVQKNLEIPYLNKTEAYIEPLR